jgi:hypothetical protein
MRETKRRDFVKATVSQHDTRRGIGNASEAVVPEAVVFRTKPELGLEFVGLVQ